VSDFVPNLRDVGGLDVAGGRVRTGRLMRSALPSSDDLVPAAIVWPPRVVVDLRSDDEIESEHPLSGVGATVHRHPLLSALRPGVAPPRSLVDLYALMLRTSTDHLVKVVERIADSDGPTLVHCAAGKDRTGVSIALTLALLGAHRDEIIDDYLISGKNEGEIEARFSRVYGQRRAVLPPGYLSTPMEAIVAVLDVWEAYDGGVRAWFVDAGGDQTVVTRLRESLVS